MRRISLLALVLLVALVSLPFVHGLGPVQPPVDTDTLYVGTIAWGPTRADPMRAYDTASGELLFNVYDTLITCGSSYTNAFGSWSTSEEHYEFVPMLATNVPDRQLATLTFDATGINTADPTCFWFQVGSTWYHVEGWVDNNANGVLDVVDCLYVGEYTAEGMAINEANTARTWSIQSTGTTWTLIHYFYDFTIRTSPVVTFYDNTGAAVGTLESDDVVFSLQRALVNDQSGSPVWMYYKPLFDQMDSSAFVNQNTPDFTAAWLLTQLIKDAIETPASGVVRINVGIAFADVGFKQVLAQTWGSIMEKDWLLATGETGTSRTNFNMTLTGLNVTSGIPMYIYTVLKHTEPFNSINPLHYAGSGPYRVTVAASASNLVVLQRNPNYWGGWPAPGRKAYLEFVNIEYLSLWNVRKTAFIAGQLDVGAVPRNNMMELMNPFGEPFYPYMKTIKNISPSLSMDSMFYTFTIDPASASLYGGLFPTGIPANFFNNTHVRRAFSYAFDRATFLQQAWMGEAIVRETPVILGLYPDYYNYGPDPPWTYNLNITRVIEELKLAFMPGDPVSVWDHNGFKLDVYYLAGASPRQIGCLILKSTFDTINSQNPGKNFQVVLKGIDWPVYLTYMENMMMPVWEIGWLADYADAGNWFGPYMHSNGDFSYYQNYSAANGWDKQVGTRSGIVGKDEMIDRAFLTADGTDRQSMYFDLNDIFVNEVPNLPTSQPLGRRWAQYWVKGWEFDTLWPSQYYYHLYKEDACWADVTSATTGLPDGKTDMRDIGYIAGHFGARAPDTSQIPPYDPKWAPGTYGMAGCDVYGDRKVDMRDIGFAAAHFGHTSEP